MFYARLVFCRSDLVFCDKSNKDCSKHLLNGLKCSLYFKVPSLTNKLVYMHLYILHRGMRVLFGMRRSYRQLKII